MPSNDNFRTCICKHITPLDTCWAILRKFEKFWVILNNFEQFWAMFSNFQQLWAILSSFFGPAGVISSNFEHFCRASLGHVSNTIWHCRPWTVFKMSQLRLLWDILLWLKKVADVNPTDLDPKTRLVTKWLVIYIYIYMHITPPTVWVQTPRMLQDFQGLNPSFPLLRLKFFQAVMKCRPCRGAQNEVPHATWKANLEPFRVRDICLTGIFWTVPTDGNPKSRCFSSMAQPYPPRAFPEAGTARTKHVAAARPELCLWGLHQPWKITWWVITVVITWPWK